MVRFLGLWGANTALQSDIEKSKAELALGGDESQKSTDRVCGLYPEDSVAVRNSSRRIVDLMLEKGTPGLTVCVSKRGQVVWKAAFGFCDVENQLTCDPDAQMRIASISKPMFATTILAPMIEQNKLNLKDSIHKYLSEEEFPKQKYQNNEHDITVEELLSHTSGIKHYTEFKPEECQYKPIGSQGSKKVYQPVDQFDRDGFYQRRTFRNVIEALEPFKAGPLAGEPGKYLYTTYGYTLVSAVAQKVHQAQDDKRATEQIEDFWVKVLRREWNLKNTYLDQDEIIIPKRARYYLRTSYNGGLINAPYTDLSVKWAGGGINSNTQDLVTFANTLIDIYKERNNAKLKKSTLELLWKEVSGTYALGYSVRQPKSGESSKEFAVYHSGGALGASSILIIFPESEIVVAILTNMGDVGVGELGFYIAKQFDD